MNNLGRVIFLVFLFVIFSICAVSFAESVGLKPEVLMLEGGDGSSKVRALIIKYTGNYDQSIGQEIVWINDRFGAQGSAWSLVNKDTVKYLPSNRIQDILTIKVLDSGEEKVYHFDITDPFIKLAQKITNG